MDLDLNLLVLGHKQHGKGTFSKLLKKYHGLESISSSMFANNTFLFNKLAPVYGYDSAEECFEDRHDKRDIWFDEIKSYNMPDRTRLAREIYQRYSVYDGMRSNDEFSACLEAKLFDIIFWVDASGRKPLESKRSMDIEFDPNIMTLVDNNGPDHIMAEYVKDLDFNDPKLFIYDK